MKQLRKAGRYDRVEEAVHPGPALPHAPKHMKGKIEIVTAAVEDPNLVGREKLRRQRVAVNAHTDALEMEFAYHRISTAAYLTGRAYQQVLEISRGRRVGGLGFEPTNRASTTTGHEWAIISRIERAEDAVELILSTRAAIGAWSEFVVSAVLGDGLTFRQIAAHHGKGTDWHARAVARAFREGLEALSTEWGSYRWMRGRDREG